MIAYPIFPRTISHFLCFKGTIRSNPQSVSKVCQIRRHEDVNLVLLFKRDHIISLLRPFISSQAGSRYYFRLSNQKYFPVLLLRFAEK